MNFSQVIEQGDVVLELKYCERCGGLWLRPRLDDESYCEGCRTAMTVWLQVRKARPRSRRPDHRTPRDLQHDSLSHEDHSQLVVQNILAVVDREECDFEPALVAEIEEMQI